MILCSKLNEEDIRKIQSSEELPKQSLTSPEKSREDIAYKKYLELATEKTKKIQKEETEQSAPPQDLTKTCPKLKKYARMLKMKIPEVAVRNRMLQDGVDPNLLFKSESKEENVKPKFRDSLIWQSILDFDDLHFDADPDLFDASNAPEAPVLEKKKSKKRKYETFIEDQKLSQQMHLIVGSLKQKNKSLLDVQRGMWALESMPIPLESLLGLKLSDDIMKKALLYSGRFNELDNASKLLFALRNIPNLGKRLEMWSFAIGFDSFLQGTREHIELVREAVVQIQSNEKLHKMLNLCCRVLQAADENGKYEHGFHLHKLFTLSRRKIAKTKRTWLQHICTLHPENAQEFIEELNILSTTLKYLDLDTVGSTITSTITKLKNCAEQVESYEEPRPDRRCRDCFVPYFTDFLNLAFPELLAVKKRFEQLLKMTSKVALDLGEEEMVDGKINTEFIKILNTFREETKKAIESNKQADARDRRKSMTKSRSSGGENYFRYKPEK